jgi:hypothetical protein
MEVPSIYAQALGPAFANLAPALKRLHGSQQRRFTGVLTIRTGSHPLVRLSLWLARLPNAPVEAPCHLCLIPSQRGERWQRHIGPWKFITHQRAVFSEGNWPTHRGKKPPTINGEIRERFGAITLGLHLRVIGKSLCVHSTRTWFLGILLPDWFGIRVVAHEKPVDTDSFYLNVRVYLPGLGALLQYRGTLRSQECLSPSIRSLR